jgi:head-tail adaptor
MRLVPAGQMRYRIDLQEKQAGTPSEYGDAAETWQTVHSGVPAKVADLGGGELFRAKQVHAEAQSEVTFWRVAGVTTAWRFVWHAPDGPHYLYPLEMSTDECFRQMQFLCKERPEEAQP